MAKAEVETKIIEEKIIEEKTVVLRMSVEEAKFLLQWIDNRSCGKTPDGPCQGALRTALKEQL